MRKKLKAINRKINSILVTFGGSDPNKYTEIIIKLIPDLIKIGFEINLIIPNQRKVDYHHLKQSKNLIIYDKFISISDIGMSTDLAICSGGGTLWEMCCLGIPVLAIPQSKNEFLAISYLTKKNACISLDRKSFNQINLIDKIKQLSLDFERRLLLSENGKKEVDGLGIPRVINKIIKNKKI